ncbi:ABC-F family ATP-binding cassette domain-containing protein [Hydrocarboniphaga effusa]|jgi:ATP-binding cassette subfamily F protein 3|uniref:Probable ATP-binding protein YheS n=1 Tax=Hydrocarboniphaga effusa AP103 TaxID=1172194 RepID=I7ZBJ4_9GAMM|nr:ATP-binding cassette domain-containing protein [Hydrocarboniphaga effusa]EIT68997.1 ABC transporter related protein [Hydrocarboniphaga effusa AP103]
MISASRLTLRRGPRALLEDANFSIHGGWHVGLIGRNGTGKSTLFAAVLGQLAPDKGEMSSLKHLDVATAAQETPALPDLAIDFALDGDVELRDLERRLEKAEAAEDIDTICAIHERLAIIGGYSARARAASLLHGLSFSQEAQQRPVSSFSGGWRMRLNLARALMRRSDVLLLDEPTNHLDLDAVIWLQGWLKQYPGTLMVISHDREFLDDVTTHTLHLENQKATLYTGNYSQFERQRAERMTLQAGAYAKQQKQVAHLQKFINRFRASAAKATQAQSRIKALERMEMVSAVHADSEFSFEFPEPDRLPSPLVRFDDVTAGYGEAVILDKLRVLVAPGERIGLLGQNGAGKSTLVQTIAGAIPALGGELMRDPHLRVGYFAQHTTEELDADASPIVLFRRIDPRATEQSLRTFLGGFNFKGDRVYEPVGPFSGGEKARLALAMVVYQSPNLLLLDEPTNHLDLDMRHALEHAMMSFAGAVLVVSHDRHLLTSTCEKFWLIADGRCVDFDGDLDDYAKWLNTRDLNGAAKKPGKRAAV